MIFKGGSIELIFSLCNPSDDVDLCDDSEYRLPVLLEEQFEEIENELNNVKDFPYYPHVPIGR